MPTLTLTFSHPEDTGRPNIHLDIADDSIEDIDVLVNEFLDVTSEREREEFCLVSTEIVDGDDAVLDWMKAFIERPFRVKSGKPVNPTIEDVIERLENADTAFQGKCSGDADTAFQNKCNGDADALRALLYAHGATYHDEDLGKVEALTKMTKREIIDYHIDRSGPISDALRCLLDEDAVLREALEIDETFVEYNESYYRIDE
jgi:hypothetical protein